MRFSVKPMPFLAVILLIGLALRLFALANAPLLPQQGGDDYWYLVQGASMSRPEVDGYIMMQEPGIEITAAFDKSLLPTAPGYIVFVGFWQAVFPQLDDAVLAIRLTQIAASLLTVCFVYGISLRLASNQRAALIVAGALSLAPVWILEPTYVTTETLYITAIAAGIWLYMHACIAEARAWRWLAAAGLVFGLATLVRAVGLLFPLGLAGHWLMVMQGRERWRAGLSGAVLLLGIYSVVVATWTVHNLVYYDRFVIASSELTAAIWRGATPESGSPQQNDELLGDQTPGEQALEIIQADTGDYLRRRVSQLATSYITPHGLLNLGGESLRVLALRWVDTGFSMDGLRALLNGEGFWIKLIIYIWHYAALFGGVLGFLLSGRRWRLALIPAGFIAYTTLLHFILLALPRYIFPAYICFLCLTALLIARLLPENAAQKG